MVDALKTVRNGTLPPWSSDFDLKLIGPEEHPLVTAPCVRHYHIQFDNKLLSSYKALVLPFFMTGKVIWNSSWGIIHIWRPWKWSNFQDPHPPCPSMSIILRPPWPWTSNFKRTLSRPHPSSPNDNQSIKRKHNPRMNIICYQVIPSGRFSFSLSHINLIWLSFDFFSFNRSLTIWCFVALYSCVCNCQLRSIIHFYIS